MRDFTLTYRYVDLLLLISGKRRGNVKFGNIFPPFFRCLTCAKNLISKHALIRGLHKIQQTGDQTLCRTYLKHLKYYISIPSVAVSYRKIIHEPLFRRWNVTEKFRFLKTVRNNSLYVTFLTPGAGKLA